MKYLIILLALSSCTSPDKWPESSHEELMLKCRTSCGKNRMLSYESLTGECNCIKSK